MAPSARWRALLAVGVSAIAIVVAAEPASAHTIGTGALPVPTWTLAYVGAAILGLTALTLRSLRLGPRPPRIRSRLEGGRWLVVTRGVGLTLLALTLVACFVGPDTAATNLAPIWVLIVLWIGLPIVSTMYPDTYWALDPFAAVTRPIAPERTARTPPPWTAAAFLLAFEWFLLCYHRPGSPRALGVLLLAYTAAAVVGARLWGRAWLREGEGFGGIAAALGGRHLKGLLAIVAVWLGGTTFDALSGTRFWIEVLGRSSPWGGVFLDTIGLTWMIAVVAALLLGVARFTERRTERDRGELEDDVARAAVPVALGWFFALGLPVLLFDGQNAIALASDPISRGWNLFGTISTTPDYTIASSTLITGLQLIALLAGHVLAVAFAHEAALRSVGARAASRITAPFVVLLAASFVSASILLLGAK